jgi:hypothetical protein
MIFAETELLEHYTDEFSGLICEVPKIIVKRFSGKIILSDISFDSDCVRIGLTHLDKVLVLKITDTSAIQYQVFRQLYKYTYHSTVAQINEENIEFRDIKIKNVRHGVCFYPFEERGQQFLTVDEHKKNGWKEMFLQSITTHLEGFVKFNFESGSS